MKIIPIFILILLGAACSSSYTPSAEMLALKKDMSAEQASQIMQTIIWNPVESKGICDSRGFWFDENANMLVHENSISMLAHKRGKQLRSVDQKFGDLTVFEKQYYKYEFEFNKLSLIDIYNNPKLLPTSPGCNKKDLAENYLIIDLHADELNNLKFIVSEKDFDKAMAALTVLLPDIAITIK